MQILKLLLFGSYNNVDILTEILFSVSLIPLFRKCGVRWFWALVPVARTFFLGKCADREPEGKICAVIDAVNGALLLMLYYTHANSFPYFGINAVIASLGLVTLINRLKIYLGMCDVFEVRKLWTVLWVFAGFAAAGLWGLSKRFQPAVTVPEMDAEDEIKVSGNFVTALDHGLTVNLEDRTHRSLLEKKYLLRDIHLVIPPGHMVLLLGGSGAGKTTLINAVNGYEKANASVMLNGSNVYKEYKQILHEIGYVPQKDLMRDHDTVYRTLSDAAALRMTVEADAQDRRKQVEEVLGIFGLGPVRRSLVSKLSGGQRKRLSIAMEYIANPSLFILDEPDSGLDGVMARELMERLKKISQTGKIVIVITHTPDRVIDLFDDVIVLAKDSNLTGRLAFYGSIADAREFFGKERMEQIVMSVNRVEEGGEGRADEFVNRFVEVQNV